MSNAELMVALRDAINRSGLTKTEIREQTGVGNATIEYVFGLDEWTIQLRSFVAIAECVDMELVLRKVES